MIISTELLKTVALLVTIVLPICGFISHQLDKINKTFIDINKTFTRLELTMGKMVPHEICEKRRLDCSCKQDIDLIRKDLREKHA